MVKGKIYIGDYKVCKKCLKDRRQKELSYEDISHYEKIAAALEETIRLMNEPCLSELNEKIATG